MSDQRKTKAELLRELQAARDRISELEAAGDPALQTDKAAEAQARYRLVWDTAADMITWHDAADGYAVVAANPAVMASLGYSEEELLGANALAFIHPDDLAPLLARRADDAGEDRVAVQLRLRKKDGTYAWMEVVTRPGPTEDRGQGILCVTRDITERKSTEDALRLYEMAVEGSTDFVVAIDRNYVYLLANEAFLQYHHTTRDQVVGHPAAEVLGEEFFAKLKPYCDRCLRGEREEFEVPQGTPGVNYRINHVSYYPLQSSDGQTVGVVAIIRDATPERELDLRRGVNAEMLQLVNAQISEDDLLAQAMRLLSGYAGCEATATRMRGGDGPPLCALGDPPSEAPADACICGNVLSGSLDAAQPYCTPRGGFWTNSLSTFRGEVGVCRVALSQGYESVAVLPLRAQAETIGLVYFHDLRPGRFTAAGIAFLQRLVDSLAIGLAHRQSQQALRASEMHLRTVLENIGEMVYESEMQTPKFTYVSPAAERILGYTAEEIIQMGPVGYEQRVHPDNAGAHRVATRRLVEAGDQGWREPPLQYRWRHKDGEYRWLSAKRSLLRDENGRPAAIVGAVRDITERKRGEDALRQGEARYRLVVENAGVPILIINRDGVLEMLNTTAAELLHGLPEDFVGKTIWELVTSPVADQQMAAFRRTIETGEPTVQEQVTNVHGREFWFAVRADPIRNEDGSVSRVQVVAHDITERKQTEQDLLTYQEHLRTLTSELALTEERERRQIAADLHDHIGQALSIAAMKVGVIEADVGAPDARQALREVGELIGQALHATRSLTFELSPPILYDLGLGPALEWLAEHVQGEHAIEVSFRDDGADKMLDGDIRVTLFKGVREALFNVVKHARAGKAEVALSCHGDSIEVRIRDDGAGFDPAAHDDGFGLFSVRERLHQLGGRVEIDSRPGHGTCVTLTAPLRDAWRGGKEDGR